MRAYIIRRIALFIPTAVFASIIVFVIVDIAPGDVVTLIIYEDVSMPASEAARAERLLRTKLGLDKNIVEKYGIWLKNVSTGHLGRSLFEDRLVILFIKERIPITMELAGWTFLVAFLIAVPLGMVAAINSDTWIDRGIQLFSVAGLSVPSFWTATMVLFVMSKYAGWIPLGWERWGSDDFDLVEHFKILVFPVLILAWFIAAPIMRLTRSQMMEVLREDYIRTARAKGLRPMVIYSRHALRNALIPVLTLAGWYLGRLAGGAIILEQVFSMPGLGQLMIRGVDRQDYPVVMALMLITVIFVLVLNLIVDLAYAVIDPRIRYA